MRSEAEIRRAFYLLGAIRQFNDNGTIQPMPQEHAKLVNYGHSQLAWVQGKNGGNFDQLLHTLESELAAADMQIVEVEGGAQIMPLRDNHRTKRASTWKH